jgi:hypothetical protein
MKIIINPINLVDVLNYPDKYNVNNLYDIIPKDYNEICNSNNTKHWVELFHTEYKLISITNKYHINWIKEAYSIGKLTRRFPNMYKEDLDILCKEYGSIFHKEYFIRTEHTSLKDGIYGVGPYTSLKNAIESISTCTHNHYPIHKDDTIINIYLMEWKTFDKDNEFRVFVFNNHITAISSQFVYCKNKYKSKNEIKQTVIDINNFFKENIKDKLLNKNNYTFDLCLTDKGYYFIEPNPFGKDYSAGSSLFHWINDSKVLCNEIEDIIEFRYTV